MSEGLRLSRIVAEHRRWVEIQEEMTVQDYLELGFSIPTAKGLAQHQWSGAKFELNVFMERWRRRPR